VLIIFRSRHVQRPVPGGLLRSRAVQRSRDAGDSGRHPDALAQRPSVRVAALLGWLRAAPVALRAATVPNNVEQLVRALMILSVLPDLTYRQVYSTGCLTLEKLLIFSKCRFNDLFFLIVIFDLLKLVIAKEYFYLVVYKLVFNLKHTFTKLHNKKFILKLSSNGHQMLYRKRAFKYYSVLA